MKSAMMLHISETCPLKTCLLVFLVSDDTSDETNVHSTLVTDNNDPKPAGQKSAKRKLEEEDSSQLRASLCLSLAEDENTRPKRNQMYWNGLGHVYYDG